MGISYLKPNRASRMEMGVMYTYSPIWQLEHYIYKTLTLQKFGHLHKKWAWDYNWRLNAEERV